MDTIPVEILDAIFEDLHSPCGTVNIHDDPAHFQFPALKKQDLKSCSLVCQHWNDVSKPHIFRDIQCTVYGRGFEGGNTGAVVNGFELENVFNLRLFSSFLSESSSLRIRPHIRRLRIQLQLNHHQTWRRLRLTPRDQIDSDELISVLRLLPQLKELHLHDISLVHPATTGAAVTLPDLSRVRISFFRPRTIWRWPTSDRDTTALLGCFTDLPSVDLAGGRDEIVSQDSDFGLWHLHDLHVIKRLTIRDFRGSTALLKQLTAAPKAHIENFMLHAGNLDSSLADDEDVGQFIARFGPQFRTLRFFSHIDSTHYFALGAQVADFSSCINLEEFTIGMTLFAFDSMQCNKALSDVAEVLQLARLTRYRYPALKKIALNITVDLKTLCEPAKSLDGIWMRNLSGSYTLDATLMDTVRDCKLPGIHFERLLGDGGEVVTDFSGMLPKLHAKHQAFYES